ncbi:MAG: DUF881 domain-containing protein [Candidatus Limnocylindrales bacterium]|jgi:uncharacterized protein YlxW (UPF0749 family)
MSGMRSPRAQWTIAFVALVLGFLAIVQLRAQAGGVGLANLSETDLTTLIASLNQRNTQLAAEVSTLQSQARALQQARDQGVSAVGGLRDDLTGIRLWAGLDPVTGPGVVVECAGPMTADEANELLNELRLAGAEALAVSSVRVVTATVVAGPPGALSVENLPLPSPFQVSAIGDSINLTASLTRVGGIVSQLQVTSPGVQVTVAPSGSLVLPATDQSLIPADGQPRR